MLLNNFWIDKNYKLKRMTQKSFCKENNPSQSVF